MVDYAKPFPCTECGKMVMSNEKHTFEDCKKQKKHLQKTRDKVINAHIFIIERFEDGTYHVEILKRNEELKGEH